MSTHLPKIQTQSLRIQSLRVQSFRTQSFRTQSFRSIRQSTIAILATIGLTLSLTGCIGSKVNQANYDKIETGITGLKTEKVKEILGEPTEQQSGGIGLGGVGIEGRTMTWKDGNRSITIIFLNDQAVTKSQQGL